MLKGGKMLFIKYENKNLVAVRRAGSKEIEFLFKPNCDKRIIEMYNELKKPTGEKK